MQFTRKLGSALATALLVCAIGAGSASALPPDNGDGGGGGGSTPAPTTTLVDKSINVREGDALVDANVEVQNGDEIDISASGSIWAGVWLTGGNGPDGWVGWSASNDSPLPGVAPFSLLGHTAEDGYFVVGRGTRWTYQNASLGSGKTRLEFEINDNWHGNGNGSFQVHLIVRR